MIYIPVIDIRRKTLAELWEEDDAWVEVVLDMSDEKIDNLYNAYIRSKDKNRGLV